MPSIGDTIETVIVTELVGVPMSTRLLWKIDDLGLEDTIFNNIVALAAAYRDTFDQIMSTAWEITCITYTNLTAIEAKVVAPVMLFGSSIVDPHPQNQTLNVRRWGLYDVDQKVRNGRVSLSGVTEDFSRRGRFTDMTQLTALEDFLGGPTDLSAGLWSITPALQITPDWKNFPLIQVFIDCFQAEVDPVFSVMTRRKTKLCGTA